MLKKDACLWGLVVFLVAAVRSGCHTLRRRYANVDGMMKETTVIQVGTLLRKLSRDKSGVTALEYGIIAGVLGLVLIGIFQHFGSKMSTLFSTVGGSI